MQEPIGGVGTRFRRWADLTWSDIAQITGLTGPGLTKETIDVTALDSLGGYRKFIGSFRDGGTVTLSMNYTRAGYDQMKADYELDCTVDYEIVFPDGNRDNPACTTSVNEALNTTFAFKAIVTELPLTVAVDSQITMEVTLKVSGKVYVSDGEGAGTPTYV